MNPNAQSIGSAIPIHLVRSVLPDLRRMGRVYLPNLGFSGKMVRLDNRGNLELGFAVMDVAQNSPAERTGMRGRSHRDVTGQDVAQQGDVIVSVNGKRLASAGDISRAISASKLGAELVLHVLRGTKLLALSLVMPEMQHHATPVGPGG